ncbi:MAG: hypothetical protein J6K45_01175 [Clostridia bacterium]|nr:hypothetical protein [Clostridia bacterium]
MENASKALLIAGAILICILLIAIGMYIYNSAQTTIQTAAGQMNQQDKQMYNSMIQKYIGTKSGSEIKRMIEDTISQNNQYVNESGKFISILQNGVGTYSGSVNSLCNACNAYTNASGFSSAQADIDKASTEMRNLAKKISAGKNYDVHEYTEDGIIYAVIITELDPATGDVKTAVPAAAPTTP